MAMAMEEAPKETNKSKKKSAAQVRRMQRRAAARGTEYAPPPPPPTSPIGDGDGDVDGDVDGREDEEESMRKATIVAAARKLRRALSDVDGDASLNAKARRSARRRAEAVASEEVGLTASELLAVLEETKEEEGVGDDDVADAAREADASKAKERGGKKRKRATKGSGDDGDEDGGEDGGDGRGRKGGDPYVLFVGQLAYSTTADDLRGHFREALGGEATSPAAMKIRLLTTNADEKKPATKKDGATGRKSRGMAFVELSDPETMHECLKLHHTTLQERRINVERSAGGGKNSDRRKAKLKQYRDAQTQHMSETVDAILAEYVASGDVREGELDEGVVALCKRSHTAASVQEALAAYVEEKAANGEKDNPSAYVTHLLGRAATEGLGGRREDEVRSSGRSSQRQGQGGRSQRQGRPTSAKGERGVAGRENEREGEDAGVGDGDSDRGGRGGSSFVVDRRGEGRRGNDVGGSANVGKTGETMSTDRALTSEVDMSMSRRENGAASASSAPDYSRIFPSMSGRGRGARRGGVGRA